MAVVNLLVLFLFHCYRCCYCCYHSGLVAVLALSPQRRRTSSSSNTNNPTYAIINNANTNANSNISIEPLVYRIFNEELQKESEKEQKEQLYKNKKDRITQHDNHEEDPTSSSEVPLLMESLRRMNCGLLESSRGIQIWNNCLRKGRTPIIGDDFDDRVVSALSSLSSTVAITNNNIINSSNNINGGGGICCCWPPQPFFDTLVNIMTSPELQLPRMAMRHPEMIPILLRSIVRKTIDYVKQCEQQQHQLNDDNNNDDDEEDDEYDYFFYQEFGSESDNNNDDDDTTVSSGPAIIDTKEIAQTIAANFVKEWTNVVTGIGQLDAVFGYSETDFLLKDDDNDNNNDDTNGFGLSDGIWSHTGWKVLADIQNQLLTMDELQQLMKKLGRRPTAEDKHDGKYEKFSKRKRSSMGGLGPEFDPYFRKESMTGLTLSNNLSEMLPSEAILLLDNRNTNKNKHRRSHNSNAQSSMVRDEDDGKKDDNEKEEDKTINYDHNGSTTTTSTISPSSSSSVLRKLFLAKMAESKLKCYEISGWADVPSIPKITRPLYRSRMPSGPGGPIIVCLDTSWSMSGRREMLSKAVVLACVTEANRQHRDCQIVSFSSSRQVIESGIITPTPGGIHRMLEFLSYGFGGGTDVTGALKFAINALEGTTANDDNNDINTIMSADILLVTDGEISDPPVPDTVMKSLHRLVESKGVEIHGLLIGKSESVPLTKICTTTHNFLSQYDGIPTITKR